MACDVTPRVAVYGATARVASIVAKVDERCIHLPKRKTRITLSTLELSKFVKQCYDACDSKPCENDRHCSIVFEREPRTSTTPDDRNDDQESVPELVDETFVDG